MTYQGSPIEIKREPDGLSMRWSDGTVARLASTVLRRQCPCAMCKETRGEGSHSSPLTPGKANSLKIITEDLLPATKLERVEPVGTYGLRLIWADGHNDGIYTFDFLLSLIHPESGRSNAAQQSTP